MDKFVITGGTALQGEIPVNGSKNSALPALAAALLTEEPVTLRRIPRVRDIRTMQRLLVDIGSKVEVDGETVTLRTPQIVCPEAPYELVKTMRASSLVLGPLVARCGRARVSLPGGCAIGARPINLHIFGLEQLGARINQAHGYIEAEAPEGLRGAVVHFDRITVTGTEDLMMAAVLAKGKPCCATPPASRKWRTWPICWSRWARRSRAPAPPPSAYRASEALHGAEHAIIPDRIEAGTFLIAGAITGGDLAVTGCVPEHVGALVSKLQQAGAEVTQPDAATLRVRGAGRLRSVDVTTEEYPGFATDLQAQYMALMTQAEGHRHGHRDHLREPLHARPGTGPHGRQHPHRGQAGHRGRSPRADRRRGDRLRPARQRLAGAGRAGRARRNRHRPRLPHRPRLREDRREAGGSGGENSKSGVRSGLWRASVSHTRFALLTMQIFHGAV